MENYVYVLNMEGKPLMPTLRKAHVRKLLKSGKAKIVNYCLDIPNEKRRILYFSGKLLRQ